MVHHLITNAQALPLAELAQRDEVLTKVPRAGPGGVQRLVLDRVRSVLLTLYSVKKCLTDTI